jgi:hypothetical protein
MFSEYLPEASRNLRWLYDHGYPKAASVKLVGDRYRLEKAQRQLLFRGVDSSFRAAGRRARIVSREAAMSCRLGVDGHNIVLTIANYLSGIPVFEADDGLIRDIGALHGRLHNQSVMERSLDLTAAVLSELSPEELYIVFDSPISHSGFHSGYLKEKLKEKLKGIDPGRITVETAASADTALKLADISLIATSDSALIESTTHPVLDLARMVLEENFQAVFDSFLPILTDP